MKHEVGTAPRDLILRTKLHRPQLTAELIDRDRLISMMNRAREVPLTLVSAPAGYGKSVLVAQWAEQLDSPIATATSCRRRAPVGTFPWASCSMPEPPASRSSCARRETSIGAAPRI